MREARPFLEDVSGALLYVCPIDSVSLSPASGSSGRGQNVM